MITLALGPDAVAVELDYDRSRALPGVEISDEVGKWWSAPAPIGFLFGALESMA